MSNQSAREWAPCSTLSDTWEPQEQRRFSADPAAIITVQLPRPWQGSGKGLGAIDTGQGQGRKGGCAVRPVLAEQEQKAVKGSVRKGTVEGQKSRCMRRWCGQEQVGLSWGQAQKAQGSPVATQTCTAPRPYTDTVNLASLSPPPLQTILDQSQANSRPEFTGSPTILQGKELPNVRSPYSAKTECDSGSSSCQPQPAQYSCKFLIRDQEGDPKPQRLHVQTGHA